MKTKIIIPIVIVLMSLTGFSTPIQKRLLSENIILKQKVIDDSSTFYRSINVLKAAKIIRLNEGNARFVVLDVRKPDDYSKEHLVNAINIDFKSSDFSLKLDSLDKSKTYIVICYAGVRSKNTMKLMEELHFRKVYSIKGGMMKWRAKKLPLVSK